MSGLKNLIRKSNFNLYLQFWFWSALLFDELENVVERNEQEERKRRMNDRELFR